MLRSKLLLPALCGMLVFGACGDDDDDDGSSSAGDRARYCQLSKELDRAGSAFFAKLEKQNASAKQFEAAERRFYQKYEADLDEVEAAAPQALREDLSTLFAGIRARAGLGPSVPQSKVTTAEKRVQAYEKANC